MAHNNALHTEGKEDKGILKQKEIVKTIAIAQAHTRTHHMYVERIRNESHKTERFQKFKIHFDFY